MPGKLSEEQRAHIGRPPCPRPEPAVLEKLYVTEGRSQAEIAALFNCSMQTVCRWMKADGLKARDCLHPLAGQLSAEKLHEAYWSERQSTSDIATKLDCHPTTIQRRLRAHRVRLRSHSQAARQAAEQGKLAACGRAQSEEARERTRKVFAEVWSEPRSDEIEQRRLKGLRSANARRRTGSFVRCAWCGERVWRTPYQQCHSERSFCSKSHRVNYANWYRWHPDSPRPLLLTRLREMAGSERNPDRLRRTAEEIGATDTEVAELLFPGDTS